MSMLMMALTIVSSVFNQLAVIFFIPIVYRTDNQRPRRTERSLRGKPNFYSPSDYEYPFRKVLSSKQ